jgi:hypothetical protein
MDNVVYNFSIIILILGIIFMTVYVTKASNNGWLTYQEREMIRDSMVRSNYPKQNIYNYHVSKEYKNMFLQPSAWQNYQAIDPAEKDFEHPQVK